MIRMELFLCKLPLKQNNTDAEQSLVVPPSGTIGGIFPDGLIGCDGKG